MIASRMERMWKGKYIGREEMRSPASKYYAELDASDAGKRRLNKKPVRHVPDGLLKSDSTSQARLVSYQSITWRRSRHGP